MGVQHACRVAFEASVARNKTCPVLHSLFCMFCSGGPALNLLNAGAQARTSVRSTEQATS